MIRIKPAKNKKFIVDERTGNGEILSSTQPLKSKEACFTNIRAKAKVYNSKGLLQVINMTVNPPEIIYVPLDGGKPDVIGHKRRLNAKAWAILHTFK